jgi:hypothetical protein
MPTETDSPPSKKTAGNNNNNIGVAMINISFPM